MFRVLNALLIAAGSLLMVAEPAFSSEQIRQLESRLLEEGFDVGRMDGKLDTDTRRALKQFQMSRNIEATGRLDEATLAELQLPGEPEKPTRSGRSVAGERKKDEKPPRNSAPITSPDTGSADSQASPGNTY